LISLKALPLRCWKPATAKQGAVAMPLTAVTRDIAESGVTVSLTISPEKLCFLIIKAREFDVKDGDSETSSGSNPSDDREIGVLEETPDDPVVEELTSLIESLSEDEQIDLVALVWIGRDDYAPEDWAEVRAEAARAHNRNTANYLLGMPLFGDFLEEGYALLGGSCEEYEMNRL
jgi:hypothetical protein